MERHDSNADAIEATIGALDGARRLEKVDAARVHAARSLAVAVDAKPTSPGLWQEYREALRELTADGDDDRSVDELLAELSS